MKLQKSNHTILLVLEKGEDIVECITTFADDQDLTFTSVSGIGACDDVVLKFFNLTTKQYEEKHITEPLELTSLLGNIFSSRQWSFCTFACYFRYSII